MEQKQPAGIGPVERGVRPLAWVRVSNIAGTTRGVFEAPADGSAPNVELKTERLVPLIRFPDGWRFEREHSGRIVVSTPNGGGCVVDNVANQPRMVPEEVLFALCKALGA